MSTQYSTRAAAVTAWLIDNLPTALSIDATQVVDGPPSDAIRATSVILGDIDFEQDWAALGARNRDEIGTLHCAFYVVGNGISQNATDTLAFTLFGTLELYLRNQISAIATAAPGLWEIGVMPKALRKGTADAGRLAYFEFDLRYKARI